MVLCVSHFVLFLKAFGQELLDFTGLFFAFFVYPFLMKGKNKKTAAKKPFRGK
jgi:hypothetical protein